MTNAFDAQLKLAQCAAQVTREEQNMADARAILENTDVLIDTSTGLRELDKIGVADDGKIILFAAPRGPIEKTFDVLSYVFCAVAGIGLFEILTHLPA